MQERLLNNWNWAATTEVYCNGFKDLLTAFDTQQYWNGTRDGHDRLMAALIARHEDLADRTHLEYRVYKPTAVRGREWAAKLPESVDISRSSF